MPSLRGRPHSTPSRRERIDAEIDTVWKRTHEGPELSREEAIFLLGMFTAFIRAAHKREDAIREIADDALGYPIRGQVATKILAILDGEA